MFTQQATKEIGQLVKSARKVAGLTQGQLAQKLGYKSPQFVSNWERGEAMPPISALSKIAKFTKTQHEDFKQVLRVDFERVLNKR